jgi:transcriptional regulator with XRE-family HTH domain
VQARRKVVKRPLEQETLLTHMKAMRKEYSKTQAEVAKGLRLSRSQYTAIECGRSMLTLDHLACLAHVYHVSMSTFLLMGGL